MSFLTEEFQRAGQLSGLFFDGEHADGINNSSLSVIKAFLLGKELNFGKKNYQVVGSETHLRILEPRKKSTLLPDVDESMVTNMVTAAKNCKSLQELLKNSKREILCHSIINGVKVRGTLDILKGKKGGDLKTTICGDEIEFYTKAIEYDYPRQAVFYSNMQKLNSFVFYGLQKKYPFQVYTMHMEDFPKEMRAAKDEMEFLLYFYQKYIL